MRASFGVVRMPLFTVGVPLVTTETPPVKTPVFGPVSHSVRVSLSPLTWFVIVTVTDSTRVVLIF